MEGGEEVPQKGPAGAGQGQGQGHTPFEVTLEKWRHSYERAHAENVSKLGEIMRKDMEDRLSKLKEEEEADMIKVKEAINSRVDAFRKEEEAKAEEKTREMRKKIETFEKSFAAVKSSFSLLEQTVKNFQGPFSQETPQGTTNPNVDGSGGGSPPPQSPPTKEKTGTPTKRKKTPPEDPASTSGSPSKRLRKDLETEANTATTGGGDQAATSAPDADASTSVGDKDGNGTLERLSLDLPTLSPGKDGDKEAEMFFKDFKNQLKSPLSYLKISGTFSSEKDVLLLDKIFQMVSPTLQHLALDVTTEERLNLPSDTDWTFGRNLKILEMSIYGDFYYGFHQFTADIFRKIGPTCLEKFIGRGDYGVGPNILPDLAARNASTLTEISLNESRYDQFHSLVEMSTDLPLQKLTLNSSDHPLTVYKILEKFSKTLVSLDLKCFSKLVFPALEKLEVFSLEYNEDTWTDDFLYSEKLPALKTLTLDSCKGRALSDYTKAEALAQWGSNEALFSAFIPSGQVCSSLEELNIPHCPPESKGKNKEYADRLKAMRTLFPNVKGKWIMWK